MSAAGSKTIGENNAADVITGLIVVLVALAILALVYLRVGGSSGYEITAKINKADGLGIGTDVRISGIKIGNITSFTLDPNNFLVTVHMNIHDDVKIPTDSSFAVTQAGILGSQYVVIQPGGDSTNIAPGGAISNAAGSIDLLGTINRFMAPSSGGQSSGDQSSGSQSGSQPAPAQQSAPPSP